MIVFMMGRDTCFSRRRSDSRTAAFSWIARDRTMRVAMLSIQIWAGVLALRVMTSLEPLSTSSSIKVWASRRRPL